MKTLDLSWGDPIFLSPYWDKIDLSIKSNLPSSYMKESLPELKEAIRQLHIKEKNANSDMKKIVIGIGATQILSAILRVLNMPVIARSPYFFRFPIIASDAGVRWKACPNGLEIITNPNNPDGTVKVTPSYLNAIYDLSYNWPQYTRPINYDEDIMIFSLSKATGHASTRIGWALFKDSNLARMVENQIEYLTSGISIEAQLKALKIIKNQVKTNNTCFIYGKKKLDLRHNQLNQMKLPFEKLNKDGMFLWANSNNIKDILSSKNIIYTGGSRFGTTSDYARLNIGCSSSNFKELINRLKN